ncbi:hypothetical protein [Microbispora rosea]|uniref:hypothetical protein n=1 Tax=Microbispora rosea TaxID=58117 RepID=UPI003795F671
MIEIVARNGSPEAMLCPAFICDACRKQVMEAGNVIYAVRYPDQSERETSPLFVAHKGACDMAVQQWLAANYPVADGWSDLWDEIDDFLAYLGGNFKRSFAEDADGQYVPHVVVMPATSPKLP